MKPLKDEPVISDEAKIILDSLRKRGECDLNLFKSKFDFSNKKWDKITKELIQLKLSSSSTTNKLEKIKIIINLIHSHCNKYIIKQNDSYTIT